MNQYEELLRAHPLLANLPEENVRALAVLGHVRTYPAGAVVFQEGDPGDCLYITLEGSVRISILSPSGEELTLALLWPGEWFGELSLLDGRPRSANAIALQTTKTLVVTRDNFTNWLSERPQAALYLLKALSLRLRTTDESIGDLVFLDLAHRLAKRLLNLAAAWLEDQDKSHHPENAWLSITQDELASMLGVSRESVNKQLNQFSHRGWIEPGRGSMLVKDLVALRTFMAGVTWE